MRASAGSAATVYAVSALVLTLWMALAITGTPDDEGPTAAQPYVTSPAREQTPARPGTFTTIRPASRPDYPSLPRTPPDVDRVDPPSQPDLDFRSPDHDHVHRPRSGHDRHHDRGIIRRLWRWLR